MKTKSKAGLFAVALMAALCLGNVATVQAAPGITVDRAKEIALKDAGLTPGNVTFHQAKKEYDDGRAVYDLEFYVREVAVYEYEIDADTGAIRERDKDAWEREDDRKYGTTTTTAKATVKPGWIRNRTGWWYRNSDGSYPRNCWKRINGDWYHFDASGYMQTGWLKDGGKWYYLDDDGEMETGWERIGGKWYYFNADGTMRTGWLKDRNKWYYLKSSGQMAVNETVNGYRLNSSGVWIG